MDDIIEALTKAPQSENPAIILYREMTRTDLGSLEGEEYVAYSQRINQAIEDGTNQAKTVNRIKKKLVKTTAASSPFVPVGF